MFVELLCKQHQHISGLARYSRSLVTQLERSGIAHQVAQPRIPSVARIASQKTPFDLTTFLQTFPLAANFQSPQTLKHLTSQEMGTWLTLHRHPHTVVTVHDIFPYILRGELAEKYHPIERAFHRLAMRGLRFASHLIADSDYTKNTIVDHLGISAEKITTIPLAVDHAHFRPRHVPVSFYQQFDLDPTTRFLLTVGSDAPRKNLSRLLESFVRVREQFPTVKLVNVGAFTQREQFEAQVTRLGLQESVCIVGGVSAENLVHFYNAARLFVFPSRCEGFGLPPLEALACGTPVVCSNTTALPEVVGDAALQFDPTDTRQMAATICQQLTEPVQPLIERGLQHAQTFSWQKMTAQVVQLYETIL